MCDVPSIAVFCSESVECFPGPASKIFLKLLVTIPVAPIIIGIIIIVIIIIIIIIILDLIALIVAGDSKVSARSSLLCFSLTNTCYACICGSLADLKSVCSSQYLQYIHHSPHSKGGSFEVPV